MYSPTSLLVLYTFVYALVCPLVHTSVFLHTMAFRLLALLGTANTTFYYWDYNTIRSQYETGTNKDPRGE
ncbi:hypothetical protein B9Z19DRAFT_1196368 [Tuber borchii]|uniref:Uncharacterized protein n=1 Tax=Tuber borchii TaxID=42251 RepID=A0A2T6ZFI6_TUBBO|nr:hypothetical protein B9Z19DRAFT_1196368 [Tuber borchii]